MTQAESVFPPDFSGLAPGDWLTGLRMLGDRHGFSEPLGAQHAALFLESGDTLLVSFETMPGIQALSPTQTPLGLDFMAREGWSSLSLLSHGDTWFRDPKVYDFFDNLLDDGFFDDFERVIFYGAGPCGYAAGAFSVASPGARVLMLQPQATLDPARVEWDDRFAEMRRADFNSRFGYAPDMLQAAEQAWLIYDPRERLDAMHASLFAADNVMALRLPHMGGALQRDLISMGLMQPLLTAVAQGTLEESLFARLSRARRDHSPYLRNLLAHLEETGHDGLAERLCRNVVARMNAPRFRRRLRELTRDNGSSDASGAL